MQSSYFISVLTLMMGIVLSGVAGYFSVIGIGTIFSGAFLSAVIMAAALETSKIVAASWLYRNWSIAPVVMRFYMTIAILVLVMITSMGIFGYLSKAHIEQTLTQGGNNELQIEILESSIEREKRAIKDAENVLAMLDGNIKTLQEYDRVRGPDGAIAVRESQREERNALNETISTAQVRIAEIQEQLLPLKIAAIELESEIGPLKYIAELIYGENAESHFDIAVRWIILIIVCVFDPLAITMILAGNTGIMYHNRTKQIQFNLTEDGEYIDSTRVKNMSRDGHNLT